MKRKKWKKLKEMPPTMVLDGLRVRYQKHVLGHIRSAWGRGLWLTDSTKGTNVRPWIVPEGRTIADIADDLEVEAP